MVTSVRPITDLAVELNAPISTDDFRTLNRCLDEAIAGAVTEYGREQNQSTLDGESARGSERLGFLAHELRNLTNTAIFAFEVLKTGNVGVAGSTGSVLHRSLMGLRALIGRSLAESRFTQASQHPEPFLFPDSSKNSRPRQHWRQSPRHQVDGHACRRGGDDRRPIDKSSRRWWETCCRTHSSSPGLAPP